MDAEAEAAVSAVLLQLTAENYSYSTREGGRQYKRGRDKSSAGDRRSARRRGRLVVTLQPHRIPAPARSRGSPDAEGGEFSTRARVADYDILRGLFHPGAAAAVEGAWSPASVSSGATVASIGVPRNARNACFMHAALTVLLAPSIPGVSDALRDLSSKSWAEMLSLPLIRPDPDRELEEGFEGERAQNARAARSAVLAMAAYIRAAGDAGSKGGTRSRQGAGAGAGAAAALRDEAGTGAEPAALGAEVSMGQFRRLFDTGSPLSCYSGPRAVPWSGSEQGELRDFLSYLLRVLGLDPLATTTENSVSVSTLTSAGARALDCVSHTRLGPAPGGDAAHEARSGLARPQDAAFASLVAASGASPQVGPATRRYVVEMSAVGSGQLAPAGGRAQPPPFVGDLFGSWRIQETESPTVAAYLRGMPVQGDWSAIAPSRHAAAATLALSDSAASLPQPRSVVSLTIWQWCSRREMIACLRTQPSAAAVLFPVPALSCDRGAKGVASPTAADMVALRGAFDVDESHTQTPFSPLYSLYMCLYAAIDQLDVPLISQRPASVALAAGKTALRFQKRCQRKGASVKLSSGRKRASRSGIAEAAAREDDAVPKRGRHKTRAVVDDGADAADAARTRTGANPAGPGATAPPPDHPEPGAVAAPADSPSAGERVRRRRRSKVREDAETTAAEGAEIERPTVSAVLARPAVPVGRAVGVPAHLTIASSSAAGAGAGAGVGSAGAAGEADSPFCVLTLDGAAAALAYPWGAKNALVPVDAVYSAVVPLPSGERQSILLVAPLLWNVSEGYPLDGAPLEDALQRIARVPGVVRAEKRHGTAAAKQVLDVMKAFGAGPWTLVSSVVTVSALAHPPHRMLTLVRKSASSSSSLILYTVFKRGTTLARVSSPARSPVLLCLPPRQDTTSGGLSVAQETLRAVDTATAAPRDAASAPRGVHFFYGRDSPFSQFHAAQFVVDGVKYRCAEQFMMAEKARLFGDDEMRAKILAATSPVQMKRHGRNVRNFDKTRWDALCEKVVFVGNEAKFRQNAQLREALLRTAPDLLAEASPRDCIWGIGLSEDVAKVTPRSKWPGQNRLGKVLMRVRDALAAEDADAAVPRADVARLECPAPGVGLEDAAATMDRDADKRSAFVENWRLKIRESTRGKEPSEAMTGGAHLDTWMLVDASSDASFAARALLFTATMLPATHKARSALDKLRTIVEGHHRDMIERGYGDEAALVGDAIRAYPALRPAVGEVTRDAQKLAEIFMGAPPHTWSDAVLSAERAMQGLAIGPRQPVGARSVRMTAQICKDLGPLLAVEVQGVFRASERPLVLVVDADEQSADRSETGRPRPWSEETSMVLSVRVAGGPPDEARVVPVELVGVALADATNDESGATGHYTALVRLLDGSTSAPGAVRRHPLEVEPWVLVDSGARATDPTTARVVPPHVAQDLITKRANILVYRNPAITSQQARMGTAFEPESARQSIGRVSDDDSALSARRVRGAVGRFLEADLCND